MKERSKHLGKDKGATRPHRSLQTTDQDVCDEAVTALKKGDELLLLAALSSCGVPTPHQCVLLVPYSDNRLSKPSALSIISFAKMAIT